MSGISIVDPPTWVDKLTSMKWNESILPRRSTNLYPVMRLRLQMQPQITTGPGPRQYTRALVMYCWQLGAN